MPPPLYVISGIGGDERLFAAQRAVRDIRPLERILPAHPREPLTDYAARLARQIRITEPFDLGGASFGGMIALELARQIQPRRVFLFGSCRSPRSIAPSLRAARWLVHAMPVHPPRVLRPLVARWFGATLPEHVQLFCDMLAATPAEYIRWASEAIFSWAGVAELPMPVHHIHGERDRLIPARRVQADRVIRGAGHLLTLTHAETVNDFVAGPVELQARAWGSFVTIP